MSHDAKEKIVTAMIELISEQGFEGLSVRGVASRASVSIGAVQHHFPTKVRMLEAAMTAVASRAAQRFGELETIEDPLTRLQALIDLLIPQDTADPIARVWLNFAVRSTVDTNLRNTYVKLWASMRNQLRLLLAAAGGHKYTDETALELLALLDGLTLSVLAEHQDPDRVRRIANARVEELLRHDS